MGGGSRSPQTPFFFSSNPPLASILGSFSCDSGDRCNTVGVPSGFLIIPPTIKRPLERLPSGRRRRDCSGVMGLAGSGEWTASRNRSRWCCAVHSVAWWISCASADLCCRFCISQYICIAGCKGDQLPGKDQVFKQGRRHASGKLVVDISTHGRRPFLHKHCAEREARGGGMNCVEERSDRAESRLMQGCVMLDEPLRTL